MLKDMPGESQGTVRTLGVLDLGSGTFRLVLYGYEPGRSFRILDELREPVALGEGLARGRIAEAALERGRKALGPSPTSCGPWPPRRWWSWPPAR